MIKHVNKQSLTIELLKTEQLRDMAGSHPFMSIGLEKKIARLKKQISEFNEQVVDASLAILFSGKAVSGSRGIKSDFVSKILSPIQELIKSESAHLKQLSVGKRGSIKGADACLYLTELPTGSFGIKLSQLEGSDLFSEVEVSEAIDSVCEIIDKTTKDDASFAEVIESTSSRSIGNLKKLLKFVSKQDSIIKLHHKGNEIYIEKDRVTLGYNRITKAEESKEDIRLSGNLTGLMLDANKFEFLEDSGAKYSGKISEDLDDKALEDFGRNYWGRKCKIGLIKVTVSITVEESKVSYTLVDIDQE